MLGNILAPFLFVIVLDYAMRKVIQGKEEELGFKIHLRRGKRLVQSPFVLLSNEIEQAMRLLLSDVKLKYVSLGLRLNVRKTKAMFFNTSVQSLQRINGTEIKQALTVTWSR